MAFNFFGISIPQISLPKISLPSLPSLPKISLPFSVPSLPKISLPTLPQISLPKISLPKISLPSLPGVNLPDFSKVLNLPKEIAESGSAAVSALNLAAQGILPQGIRAGTKAAQQYLEEQAQRARWAAEAAAEAAGAVGNAAASLPKVSLPTLPKLDLPKISLPDLPKVNLPKVNLSSAAAAISLPAMAGTAVVGAVQQGGLPKIDLPKISLPNFSNVPGLSAVSSAGASTMDWVTSGNIPKIALPDFSTVPGLGLVAGAGAAAMGAVQRGELPKLDLPQISLPSLPNLGGGTGNGGNVIDTVLDARDRSYDIGIEHIAAGNLAAGGAQFGATMAADVLLPLDAVNIANKLATGRGDELTTADYLFGAIDALGVAGAVFTFGGSYAASRALKTALKTTKVGGEMSKLSSLRKFGGALGSAFKTLGSAAKAKTTKTVSAISSFRRPAAKTTGAGADISAAMRKQYDAYSKQAEAMQKAYTKQAAEMQKAITKQTESLQESFTKAVKGVNPAETSKAASVMSKTGKTLTAAGLGLGVGAIGLTALGALGGPAPQEEYPTLPDNSGGGLPGGGTVLPGSGETPWWTLPDLPGWDIPEYPVYPEVPTYDPGSDPEYVPPAYPDPLGWEPYAQDIASYLEGIPGIGGLFGAARQNGLALPALVATVILVVLGVAFLRSKKGKQMIGGVKKQVSGAVSAGKKAVGA